MHDVIMFDFDNRYCSFRKTFKKKRREDHLWFVSWSVELNGGSIIYLE